MLIQVKPCQEPQASAKQNKTQIRYIFLRARCGCRHFSCRTVHPKNCSRRITLWCVEVLTDFTEATIEFFQCHWSNSDEYLQIVYLSPLRAGNKTTTKHTTTKQRYHHDDVIKWKHFPRYWSFVRGIHRSPVISPHKGQWRGALMFSLICVWINGWVNNGEAGDLRRYRAYYDVTVMTPALIDHLASSRLISVNLSKHWLSKKLKYEH